jgi:hypothetical protein
MVAVVVMVEGCFGTGGQRCVQESEGGRNVVSIVYYECSLSIKKVYPVPCHGAMESTSGATKVVCWWYQYRYRTAV